MKVNKKLLNDWKDFKESILDATPVDSTETEIQKYKRMKELEGNPLAWMRYYFPMFCTSPFARFHNNAAKRLIKNRRWFDLLMWSRGFAKSTFTMMVVLYLALVKKEVFNILMVSNSLDNAARLLQPYKLILEANRRIINDYGEQMNFGSWGDSEFVTNDGVSFRALGAGQSPRGTRNKNKRVDCILIDDIDTDEECRNPRRVEEKFKWIQEALIPTVDVSNDYRIILCGNKISKNSIVAKCEKLANYVDMQNIRNADGKSNWAEKFTEQDIDDILRLLSYASAQKEYFNNPITEGTVFKELNYKPMMPLSVYKLLVCYTDPSFKDSKKNDFKATVLLGKHRDEFHVIKAFCEQTSTANMIDWHYQVADFVKGRAPVYYFMEANFMQDTLLQQFYEEGAKRATVIPITGDKRKKADKFTRIESLLEPLNRNLKLWFNEVELNNKHMQRTEEQFLALAAGSSAHDDAPDAVEGAVYVLNNKIINDPSAYAAPKKKTNTKRI